MREIFVLGLCVKMGLGFGWNARQTVRLAWVMTLLYPVVDVRGMVCSGMWVLWVPGWWIMM